MIGIAAAAALAAACGPGNAGMYVSGSVVASVTEASGSGPTATNFTFDQRTRVDSTLRDGTSSSYTGACSVSAGRSLRIDRVSQGTGLTSVSLTMPDWSQDNCASCQRGTVRVVTLGRSYEGADTAGAASSPCRITATRSGTTAMSVNATCTGLQGTDGSRADVTLRFDVDACGT